MNPEFSKILEDFRMKLNDNASKSSDESLKQIIFIDSGALALIATFVTTSDSIEMWNKILITVAIILFGLSVVSGVISFFADMIVFNLLANKIGEVNEKLKEMKDEHRTSYYKRTTEEVKIKSFPVPYLLSVLFFIIGLFVLTSILITKIW